MSRDRGNRAPDWLAAYLAPWWPHAERTPNGRPGADLTGTPGVVFEVKTSATWRNEWLAQARKYAPPGEHPYSVIPVLAYFPPGLGEKNVMHAQAVVPVHVLMHLLEQAGYAPARKEVTTP